MYFGYGFRKFEEYSERRNWLSAPSLATEHKGIIYIYNLSF